jgi:hypothetical protein
VRVDRELKKSEKNEIRGTKNHLPRRHSGMPQMYWTGSATGKIWRIVKYLREKVFPKNPRLSRRKRAFVIAAFEKTLEFSPVMFWKKSPTREKHRKNRPFSTSALFGRGEKSWSTPTTSNLWVPLLACPAVQSGKRHCWASQQWHPTQKITLVGILQSDFGGV